MDFDAVLSCLVEAEADERRPELCGGRYVVVSYTGSCAERYDGDEDDDEVETDEDSTGEVIGEASSFYEALDILAAEIAGEDPQETLANSIDLNADEESDFEQWLSEDDYRYIPQLRQIGSLERRLLAYFLLSYVWGPMDIETTDLWRDPYLGSAPTLFAGARFLLLASAAPPNQELAFAILECQPTGKPTDSDRVLVEACSQGDAAAAMAALAAGARVDALDERGMAPLHVATAHRAAPVVTALLAAGADATVQAEYGNAVHFAALDRKQRVRSWALGIEDDNHWQILHALIAAGAPVNAANRTGETLLDLAIATRPYPAEAVRYLLSKGAHSALLKGVSLHDHLRALPYYTRRGLEIHVNQVRFLLDLGADTTHAAQSLLGNTGYYEREVPSEILVELIDEILRHGTDESRAHDCRPHGGRTALELAQGWVDHGLTHYQPVVDHLRAAQQPV